MQFRNMLTALSSFVHGGESAQTDVPAICPPPLPPSGPQNAVVPVCPSVAMQQSYVSRQQENFLFLVPVCPLEASRIGLSLLTST